MGILHKGTHISQEAWALHRVHTQEVSALLIPTGEKQNQVCAKYLAGTGPGASSKAPQLRRAHAPAELQDELFWTEKLGAVQFLLRELSEAIQPWQQWCESQL